jgi:inorganic pyrophosphatase/exopolyphosphatase
MQFDIVTTRTTTVYTAAEDREMLKDLIDLADKRNIEKFELKAIMKRSY